MLTISNFAAYEPITVSMSSSFFSAGTFIPGKNFPGTGPLGPWMVTKDEISDPHGLDIKTRLNGEVRQQSSTAQLIFAAGYLVWAVSRVMTLHAGDIISTGTPSGIGPLRPGDVVEVEVEGVGILSNPVGVRTLAEER